MRAQEKERIPIKFSGTLAKSHFLEIKVNVFLLTDGQYVPTHLLIHHPQGTRPSRVVRRDGCVVLINLIRSCLWVFFYRSLEKKSVGDVYERLTVSRCIVSSQILELALPLLWHNFCCLTGTKNEYWVCVLNSLMNTPHEVPKLLNKQSQKTKKT